MFRFISFLIGKPYEPCKGCEILKIQLNIGNEEKKQLTETLLNLIKPKTYEAVTTELEPIAPKVMTFARRRVMLEEQDRQRARIINESKLISKPMDTETHHTVSELEKELGVVNGDN